MARLDSGLRQPAEEKDQPQPRLLGLKPIRTRRPKSFNTIAVPKELTSGRACPAHYAAGPGITASGSAETPSWMRTDGLRVQARDCHSHPTAWPAFPAPFSLLSPTSPAGPGSTLVKASLGYRRSRPDAHLPDLENRLPFPRSSDHAVDFRTFI